MEKSLFWGILGAIGVSLLAAGRASAQGGDDPKLYKSLQRSAVTIAIKEVTDTGATWETASGVLINKKKRWILTARHPLLKQTSETPLLCLFYPTAKKGRQLGPAEFETVVSGEGGRCTLKAEFPELNIALLEYSGPLPKKVKHLKLRNRLPRVGELVMGVASPHGIHSYWYRGYVNNLSEYYNVVAPLGFAPDLIFGFTSPIATGAAGAMVLDERRRLLGVTVASMFGTDTGIAIPAPLIREKLKGMK